MATNETTTLTQTIDAPLEAVSADLAIAENHPQWATEFFNGDPTTADDGSITIDVPRMGGPARMRVAADVERGIIDLYLAPGDAPYGDPLPVRLIPNGDGVDVLWTLGRPEGIPDPAWEDGLRSMSRELENLRARHEER